MKKLTFIILVLFTGNATYAQATSDKKTTTNHGKTVSTAAHTSVAVEGSADAASKGEYVSTVARSKKDEASKEAKELAKETKAQAKQIQQEQKEAAKAKAQELSETDAAIASTAQINQDASLEDGALATDGSTVLFASAQGKGQDKDKAKSDKKDAPKEKADKTKKEVENHGQKVKAAAQEATEGTKEKGQEVKEVASAKRQQKPEKVEAGAEVDVEVKAPKSAARPGRGAAKAVQGTTTAATKTVGNAAKAVKPVKVGGKVGVGSIIKVGKN
ncbi:hypothetical protein TH61_01340 [Rufibacter sp. DG15C]|jgi:colicin import membrane protein|uniref:hypothetical protein n=1 Tax=Rufibacter sp. DG15C TaxID=1379909 RepID=UPI00078DA647|nr:hypothetical protein [Rufibacter sp. DG15C]AMM50089.1 hypothetical protein TH61_01340 [Rufibacter sp. DG15C]